MVSRGTTAHDSISLQDRKERAFIYCLPGDPKKLYELERTKLAEIKSHCQMLCITVYLKGFAIILDEHASLLMLQS